MIDSNGLITFVFYLIVNIMERGNAQFCRAGKEDPF